MLPEAQPERQQPAVLQKQPWALQERPEAEPERRQPPAEPRQDGLPPWAAQPPQDATEIQRLSQKWSPGGHPLQEQP